MRLTLVLPLRDQAGLNRFLKALSDPSSASYRKFLTVEGFTAKFGPTRDDYNAVIQFAQNNGLQVVATSRNRVDLDVTGSVATVEKAFHVTMGLYQHPTQNRAFYAPDREPVVDLPFQLWRISGLDNYSIPKPALRRIKPQDKNVTSKAITGSCPEKSFCGSDMRAAYYGGTTLDGTGQSVGLLEYVGTDLADLTTYYTNVGQTNNVPITLLSTDGTPTTCTNNSAGGFCDDTEQTLDMTQALGMAPNLDSLVVYVGSDDAPILNAMATAEPLNAQIGCSWGWYPADPSVDDPYYQEFAAQGQNFFVASGDSGVWVAADGGVYPADDVYITSVGGTDLNTSGAGGAWASEQAWADGGGGISPDDYLIPAWQVTAAAGCGDCSQTYRNGPDVSANANFTFYVCADQQACTANEYGGTSFAAPMWAGFTALINQQATGGGGAPLGFLNPALYAIGANANYTTAFHDITVGSNGTYPATVGYDLATGLGSPNGAGLIDALTTALTTTTLVPSSTSPNFGQSVTLTVTVTTQGSNAPTGTVTFLNGATSIGSSPLSAGVASLTTSALPAGTLSITASYSGDASNSPSTSTVVTVNVADFTVAANPTTITISAPGQSGSTTLTVTPVGGFNQAITFTCSGLPTGATCTSTTTSTGATLTVSTTAASASLRALPLGRNKALFLALLCPGFLGLVSIGIRKPALRGMRLLALTCVIALCSLWIGCGSSSSTTPPPPNNGTPTGNSTVTVTGTAGSLANPITITVTVN